MGIQSVNVGRGAAAPVQHTQFSEMLFRHFRFLALFYSGSGKTIRFSPAQLYAELGYPEALTEHSSFRLAEVICPEDLPRWEKIRQQLQQGLPLELQDPLHFRHSDGARVPYTLAQDSPAENGERALLLLRGQENTSYLSAQSEELFGFGTFEHEEGQAHLRCSKGLYRLLGYTHQQPAIDPRTFGGYFGKRGTVAASSAQEAEAYEEEYDIVTWQGLKKRIRIHGRRLYDEQGNRKGEVGLVCDLTRQRLQETVIRKYIDELTRSNKELEEFAYIASHDLQEPLRKISTFGSRLLAGTLARQDDENSRYLERIMNSVENMRQLIDNLLEFSRISRKTEPFSPVDLNTVFRQVRQDLELQAEECGAGIFAGLLPTIDASATQMRQLFFNLIGNALKFRRPDIVPEIQLCSALLTEEERDFHRLAPEQAYYKIEFCDNGIGIEEAYTDRIFQIFQRLHGKAEYPGSGIGLAICRKIAEKHRGIIFAGNRDGGGGACFTVILPQRAGDDPDEHFASDIPGTATPLALP